MKKSILWRGGLKGNDLNHMKHAWLIMIVMANEINKLLGYADKKVNAVAYVQPVDDRVVYVWTQWAELPKLVKTLYLDLEQAKEAGKMHNAPTEPENLFWKKGKGDDERVITDFFVTTTEVTPDTLRMLIF
jgi:hypothetical protein